MRAFGGAVGYPMYPTRTALPGVFSPNDHMQMVQEDRAPTARDPFFANVKLLVHGNAVLNTGMPTDASGNYDVNWWATTAGQTPGRTFASPFFTGQTSFTNSSINGGVRCSLKTGSLAIGTADFTLECFVYYFALASGSNLIDMRPGANGAYPDIGPTATAHMVYFTNSATKITGTTTLGALRPYFVAYTRASGVGTLWLGQPGGNATSEGTWSDTTSYATTTIVHWGGSSFSGSGPAAGSLWDELRLTVGTARYSSTFPVPSTRFPDY